MAGHSDCKYIKLNTRSEQKYQDIVNAAESVFIKQGFQKASMDRIAEVACVSKRTVYKHFATKDVLFHHILENCCNQLITSTELPYCKDISLEQQLYNLLSIEWTLYASDRFVKLARVVIGEYVNTSKFIENLIQNLEQKETSIHRWLQDAIDHNALQVIDIDFSVKFLNGSIKSFAHNPLMFDQPEPNTEQKDFIIKEIVAMFLSHYKKQ